jgi:CBS domain-containing protein
VRHLLTVLAEHRIGAVVVSHNGTSVDGIASERDIVRALAQRGATVMSEPITAIYTAYSTLQQRTLRRSQRPDHAEAGDQHMRQQHTVARMQSESRHDRCCEKEGERNHTDAQFVEQERNEKAPERAAELEESHRAVGLRVAESVIGEDGRHPQRDEIVACQCGDDAGNPAGAEAKAGPNVIERWKGSEGEAAPPD